MIKGQLKKNEHRVFLFLTFYVRVYILYLESLKIDKVLIPAVREGGIMAKKIETTDMDVCVRNAINRIFTEDKSILTFANKYGRPLALIQANRGWTTDDPAILILATDYGQTVAHEQASRGWTTDDPAILSLTNYKGVSVADEIANFRDGCFIE